MKKRMVKIISSMLAIFLLCSTSAMASGVNQVIGNSNVIVFIDVPEGHWAKDQIDYFTQRGIVNGFGDGTFKPDEGVKREEFCKLLVTTFNAPLQTPNDATFTDVSNERWSYPYVEVCKDFLTGYANPFGGKPAFHPEEYATREDIAVALVRMMGYTDKDVTNESYALRKFKDGNTISPNLLGYVSLACEKGLINGYPNGTFGPNSGITRAETVVLLNRATKQAVTNINAELPLTANVIYGKDGKTVTVNVVSEEGAQATVDGNSIVMSSNHYDAYEGNYIYTFEEEGTKEFTVTAKKGAKEKTITVSAKYEIDAPKLVIEYCPANTKERNIVLKGEVSGGDHHVTLTINEKMVGRQGLYNQMSWTEKVKLEEGENVLKFVATNSLGKTTEITRTVVLNSDAPTLEIISCPENVTNKYANVKGKIFDANYPVTVTVNGKEVGYSTEGNSYIFNYDGELNEGENILEIEAKSLSGKTAKETKKVYLTADGPELKITTCPQSVYENKVTIKGSVYDRNYGVTLYINGEEIDSNDNGNLHWEQVFTLKEGENVFDIEAKSLSGKTSKITKVVNYIIEGPELKITSCPETSTQDNAVIRGTAFDLDYALSVMINGEVIASRDSAGTLNWSKRVTLEEGENTFEIVCKSDSGKLTKETVVINFVIDTPELDFLHCPEVTQEKNIAIQVNITSHVGDVKLYINDEEAKSTYNNLYTTNVKLSEGDNQFIFRVVNEYGKSKTVVKNIKLVSEITAPTVTLDDFEKVTDEDEIKISGVLSDDLDEGAVLYINDEKVLTGNGDFAFDLKLKEGKNDIIIVATNKYGKSKTIVESVTMNK